MESAFNKIGLYDFLGILMTGMITIGTGFYLGLPITVTKIFGNEVLTIVLFLMESYFIGLILQEISSIIDHRYLKISDIALSTFLNTHNPVVSNPVELKTFRKIANHMLGKPADNIDYTPNEQKYVFLYCRVFLEIKGKSGKYEEMLSKFTMSRSLMLAFPVLACWHFLVLCRNLQAFGCDIALFLLALIFYSRFKNSIFFAVRVVLRYYYELNNQRL